MHENDNPDPKFGLADGGYELPRRTHPRLYPDGASMVEEMDLQVGDIIHDHEFDVEHIVTSISTWAGGCELLLDAPDAETYDDLYVGGISTGLSSLYAKWRRGNLEPIEHRDGWAETVEELREQAGSDGE